MEYRVEAQAYKQDVRFNQLISNLTAAGKPIPTGAGISVALAEANVGAVGTNAYFVTTSDPEFTGKTFTDLSNLSPRNDSGHATAVARLFFGTTSSMSPGVTSVGVYDAGNFVGVKQRLGNPANPDVVTASVLNHSYVGNFPTAQVAAESNARLDYTVQRDNVTSLVGLTNGVGAVPHIYGQSYNSIVVGLSNGGHSRGGTTIGVTGRTKPDIVVPASLATTSNATPVVSSATTLLHSAAEQLGFANARNSDTIKAITMAGADKDSLASWSNTSTRPLDSVFGAGELDILNSYRILEAGEFAGNTSFLAADSRLLGWDSGSITAGQNLYWNFHSVDEIRSASLLVTWNAKYADANGDFSLGAFSLANLRLSLLSYNGVSEGAELFFSDSPIDNVEHLYLRNLAPGRYTLRLSSDIATDFGLAWNITAVPEPSTWLLVSVVSICIAFVAWRKRKSTLSSGSVVA
jgi:hypothetical protein